MPGWGSILRSSSSAALRVLGLGLQEVSVVLDWQKQTATYSRVDEKHWYSASMVV